MSPTDERALQFYRATQAGTPVKYLANKYVMSVKYVHVLVARGQRVAEDLRTNNPALDLPAAARNALAHCIGQDPTPELVIERFKTADQFTRVPALGTTRIAAIQSWLKRHGHEEIL